MPRVTYWQVFRLVDANTLQVLRPLKVGNIEFDTGATITRGTIVAGLDFFKYLNSDIEGDEVNGAFVLRRVYPV